MTTHAMLERYDDPVDPRPDLTDDSSLWTRLMAGIYGRPHVWPRLKDKIGGWVCYCEQHSLDHTCPNGAYATLHFLRCGGARIVYDVALAGYRIVPGEWDEGGYRYMREQYLKGYGVIVTAGMRALGIVRDPQDGPIIGPPGEEG